MKLSRLLIFLCFLGYCNHAMSQNQFVFGDPQIEEKGVISHQLPDGTIWVVGSATYALGGNIDVFAVKIDTGGNYLSPFYYYGTLESEYPNNMIYQNGKFIIAGEEHSATGVDGMILVIDTLGAQVSLQTYGQPITSEQFFDIKETQDGGFVVSGFSSVGPGNDFLIAKFASYQLMGWMTSHDLGTNDIGVTVLENPNGGYIVAGDQLQPSGNYNVAVMGISPQGAALWDTALAYPYNGGCKTMISLGGEVLIVGEMATSTSSAFDIYMIRIDWQGNLKWQETIPKTDNGDACFDVYLNSFNEIILTGYAYSASNQTTDAFAMHVDTLGNILNEEYYHNGSFEMGYDIKPNIYGGFIVTGFTNDPVTLEAQVLVTLTNPNFNTSLKSIDTEKLNFNLYPNPTDSKVLLPKELLNYDLKIFDLLGKEHFAKKIKNQVDINKFDKGIYLFVFNDKYGKTVYSHKLVKR